MSEPALVALCLVKGFHGFQACLVYPLNNELGNPVHAANRIGLCSEIDEGDLYFASVIGIYSTRTIDDANGSNGEYTLQFGWSTSLENTSFKRDRENSAKIYCMSDTMEASFGIEQGVHDFFRRNNNHFPALEQCAEQFWGQATPDRQEMYGALRAHLKDRLNIEVKPVRAELLGISLRYYDPDKKQILLSDGLDYNNRVFQLAHMVGLIEYPDLISEQLSDKLRSNEISPSGIFSSIFKAPVSGEIRNA